MVKLDKSIIAGYIVRSGLMVVEQKIILARPNEHIEFLNEFQNLKFVEKEVIELAFDDCRIKN